MFIPWSKLSIHFLKATISRLCSKFSALWSNSRFCLRTCILYQMVECFNICGSQFWGAALLSIIFTSALTNVAKGTSTCLTNYLGVDLRNRLILEWTFPWFSPLTQFIIVTVYHGFLINSKVLIVDKAQNIASISLTENSPEVLTRSLTIKKWAIFNRVTENLGSISVWHFKSKVNLTAKRCLAARNGRGRSIRSKGNK